MRDQQIKVRRDMKKGKRLLSMMLAVVMCMVMSVFALTACVKVQVGEDGEDDAAQTEQAAPEDTTGEDTAAGDHTGSAEDGYIGEDKALEIALADAGLSKDEVTLTVVKLDYEDDRGVYEYEVEFVRGSTEYEYSIDAVTGEIRDKDTDIDD